MISLLVKFYVSIDQGYGLVIVGIILSIFNRLLCLTGIIISGVLVIIRAICWTLCMFL
jgi:hypothetical protein